MMRHAPLPALTSVNASVACSSLFCWGDLGVDSVLLAAPGTIVLRALPNHLPAQRTVMDLARPAKNMVVVSHLVIVETAQRHNVVSYKHHGLYFSVS